MMININLRHPFPKTCKEIALTPTVYGPSVWQTNSTRTNFTLNQHDKEHGRTQLRSCVKVEVAVLGFRPK